MSATNSETCRVSVLSTINSDRKNSSGMLFGASSGVINSTMVLMNSFRLCAMTEAPVAITTSRVGRSWLFEWFGRSGCTPVIVIPRSFLVLCVHLVTSLPLGCLFFLLVLVYLVVEYSSSLAKVLLFFRGNP